MRDRHSDGALLGSPVRGCRRCLLFLVVPPPRLRASFVDFESGPVRPLALSADGTHLFAVNTPDNRLEIFAVTAERPRPPRLRARRARAGGGGGAYDQDDVWVVNHLSDSVSVVDVERRAAAHRSHAAGRRRAARHRLRRPWPAHRAFITTAHRGQNAPFDPQLTTPGVGRADVWVFDAHRLGPAFGGVPLTIITSSAIHPALWRQLGRQAVYAAVFHSGNRTTSLNEHTVCDGGVSASCSIDGITDAWRTAGSGRQRGGDPWPGGGPDRQIQFRDRRVGG